MKRRDEPNHGSSQVNGNREKQAVNHLKLESYNTVAFGGTESGITFSGGISKGLGKKSFGQKDEFRSTDDYMRDVQTKGAREGSLHFNKPGLKESGKYTGGLARDQENAKLDSIKGEDVFSFRNSQSKQGKRPASAYLSEPRLKSSINGLDTTSKESSSAFLSNINKLKDFNSRGASASRDPMKQDTDMRPANSFGGGHEVGGFMAKKQNVINNSEGKFISNLTGSSDKLGMLMSNGKNLDQKRTELRGRLNELLDKLAVGAQTGSVRGETRSVAPILAGREGDDNLSLNSFHSTAPPLTSLRTKTGFTSFYKYE